MTVQPQKYPCGDCGELALWTQGEERCLSCFLLAHDEKYSDKTGKPSLYLVEGERKVTQTGSCKVMARSKEEAEEKFWDKDTRGFVDWQDEEFGFYDDSRIESVKPLATPAAQRARYQNRMEWEEWRANPKLPFPELAESAGAP